MKKSIVILILCIFCVEGKAQNPLNWVVSEDIETGILFSTPENPLYYDTIDTKLYAVAVDSFLALQVHIFDDASFNNSDTIFIEALNTEKGDTLRAIANLLMVASNSELTSISDILTDSIAGLEIGITYNMLATSVPYHTFLRYYLLGGRFIAFTVTGAEEDIERVHETKSLFFNSIILDQ